MKAWELISAPKAWTRFTLARDSSGSVVEPRSPQSCCWCLLGAIRKIYGPENGPGVPQIEEKVLRQIGETWFIGTWNDRLGRTQAEVVAVLKELDI